MSYQLLLYFFNAFMFIVWIYNINNLDYYKGRTYTVIFNMCMVFIGWHTGCMIGHLYKFVHHIN